MNNAGITQAAMARRLGVEYIRIVEALNGIRQGPAARNLLIRIEQEIPKIIEERMQYV